MNPQHPIFIPSKGRARYRITMRYLDRMGVPYRVIVEAAEYDAYAAVIPPERLLVLPERYLDEYDTCDDLGATKSRGPGAARNFAWDTALAEGAPWHWVMDDNICGFFRLYANLKTPVADGTILRCMEDFADRYDNVAMAGPNYFKFIQRKAKCLPYSLNTRIYSCNLIRTDLPYRWRARYNEDTDLSLRMLKDGYVTIQFNAFLQDKLTTQRIGGGNTAEFYAVEGTAAKSEMIAALHPDLAVVTERFGRVHHYVDYSVFHQQLHRRPGVVIPTAPDNYGMVLQQRGADGVWRRVDAAADESRAAS